MALALPSAAQELEPRRWSHVPVDSNFAGAAYVRTNGDIFFDPVLRIEDTTAEINSLIVSYLRSFELAGNTARLDVRLPFQQARWEGLLDGEPAAVERSGMADPRLRLSVNFIGAPALKGDNYLVYLRENPVNTIAGAALAITLPLGQYYEDKLLNLGGNRYVVRPQMGVVHQRGPWSFELTGSVLFYTDNNQFFGGNKREQDPLYVAQTHIVRSFKRGIWASLSIGLDRGGRSTLNNEKKDDRRKDTLYAISVGMPLSRTTSIKAAYAQGRTHGEIGSDTDNFVFAITGAF
jgi:hypothetical protein